jgi:hypothetical protein
MIKELKKMFPTLKRKKNPMEFIDSVLSFDKKFTLNEKENNKIRKLRMSYFKDLGLDLGDNYSLYTDSKKAKELMLDRKQKSEFNKINLFKKRKRRNEVVSPFSIFILSQEQQADGG